MLMKINGVEIAAYPAQMSVTVLDLDDADSTTRTVDGTMNRDRVAVKRQIEMTFTALPMEKISALLKSMRGVFFEVYYPDPMDGGYATRTFYAGNRPAPVAIEKNGVVWWDQLQITLTEQ
ncbi:DUF6711 family protein [Cohnella sp. AR92]|uniref:DUF6711 family protein n=1 Tax=Cohnella sp. AR92 TaxID=648716 RepID=UPI000F8F036C|nr:DUF6711 family protein [Cohnella sp. AR92]RUS47567.1 hypothetical protein ELR57_07165 [Cohnella sp. AR92]